MYKFIILALLIIFKQIAYTETVLFYSNICQSGIREDNTNYIHCARRGLPEVPQLSNKNNVVYDELVLSDNKITHLNFECFSRIKVKKVYLNGNPIEYIDENTFVKLENHLEELSLDTEHIQGIPNAITLHLRNLNTLRLKGFHTRFLTDSTFSRLNKLEILSLQASSIEYVHVNAFSGLKNSLRELYLDGNQLTQIPSDALRQLSKLNILGLSQNAIKSIDFNAFSLQSYEFMPRIKRLDLSYNGLRMIDSNALNQFNSSLETLLLQNNEISSFNFIKKVQNLRELNLDFNIITQLQANIFENSQKLTSLSIQGNTISFSTQDSFAFNGLDGLIRLNLARNNIKSLPQGLFKSFRQLKNLILDKNTIEKLDYLTFDGIQHTLINISMQNTKLKTRDLRAFKIFKRLERVKLGYNDIDTLVWSTFTSSTLTLTHLDLQSNKINHIDDPLEQQQQLQTKSTSISNQLIELDLSNNKLTSIDETFLRSLVKLKYLGLTQNPLVCDCKLKHLYEWTMLKFDKDILSFLQWKCENKNSLKFTSLSSSEFTCPTSVASMITSTTTSRTTTSTMTTKTSLTRVHHPRITDINFSVVDANAVQVKWDLDVYSNEFTLDLTGFKININEINSNQSASHTEFEIILDKNQRVYKIDGLVQGVKYAVCVSVLRSQGYDKYCRDVFIELDPMITSKLKNQVHLHEQTQSQPSINTFITFIFILMVLFVISLVLFLVIYIKKCRVTSSTQASHSSRYLYDHEQKKSVCTDCFQISVDTSTITSSTLSSIDQNKNQQICWQIPSNSTSSASPTSFNFLPQTQTSPDILLFDETSKQNILDTHYYCEIPSYTLNRYQQAATAQNESSSFRPFISNSVSII